MNRSLSNKDDGQEHLKTLKKYMEKPVMRRVSLGNSILVCNKGGKVERKRYGRIHEIQEYKGGLLTNVRQGGYTHDKVQGS